MTAVAALAKYAPRYRLEIGEPEGSDWLRVDRIVHGAQKFSYTRPIKAGDEFAATATITTVRKAGPVEVIMYETALTTVDGEPIATSTSTLSHNRADT